MTQKVFNLDAHLAQEHSVSPFSKYLREIVYGGNDGIVTTFAVVAGFAGANAQDMTSLPLAAVLLFGFANLAADGISMALGNFLSTRAEHDVYAREKHKEFTEIRKNPEAEEAESIAIMQQRGFTFAQSRQLVGIYKTNTSYWLDFMMEKELGMPNPEGERPGFMAMATFLSFIGFGFIPLLPYILFGEHPGIFLFSCMATAGALFLVGLLRWKVTRQHPLRSVGETLLLGGAAAIVAYLVGTLFQV